MPTLRWFPLFALLALPTFAEEPEQKGQLYRFEIKGGVGDLRFSPDGKSLAATGFNKTAVVYDMVKGQQAMMLLGHEGRVTCVAWSPDGKVLVTGSDDGSIRLWNTTTGKQTGVKEGVHGRGSHGTGTTTVGFFPDGKSLFSTGYDTTVHIWETSTLNELMPLEGHGDCVVANLSADGKLLATTSQDGTAKVWNAVTGEEVGALEITPAIEATSPHLGYPVFSPDGRRLFAGGGDGLIRSWTIPGLKAEPAWQAHRGFVGALDVSPDSSLAATAGMHPEGGIGKPDQRWDNSIRIWDTSTGEPLLELGGHKMSVCRTRFSLDGNRLATASWDGSVLVWDLKALDLTVEAAAGESADDLWIRLGGVKGPGPWAGMRALLADPAKALEVIGTHLEPAKADAAFSEKVAQMIRDLDHDDPAVRDRAQEALTKAGPRAETALRKALASPPSAEVKMRVREILESNSQWKPANDDERRWVRAVQALEQIGGEKATRLLETLASGDPDAVLSGLAKSALGRMGRK